MHHLTAFIGIHIRPVIDHPFTRIPDPFHLFHPLFFLPAGAQFPQQPVVFLLGIAILPFGRRNHLRMR